MKSIPVYLEYLIINPITQNIDYSTKTITLRHNIEYLLINIKKIKLEKTNKQTSKVSNKVSSNVSSKKATKLEEKTIINASLISELVLPGLTTMNINNVLLEEYYEKIKKQLEILSTMIEHIDYILTPLLLTKERFQLGLLFLNETNLIESLTNKGLVYKTIINNNFLSYIDKERKHYDMLLGILEYLLNEHSQNTITNIIIKIISKSSIEYEEYRTLLYWLVNCHNYFPKLKIIKEEKITNFFRNRQDP